MIDKNNLLYITKETKKIQKLFEKKDFNKVILKTKILLKKDPKQILFYNLIGLSYRQLNNFELAEKIFKQGLEINPNSTSILVNLGSIYRLQDKHNEAKKTIELALKINANNLSALVNYANVLRELNQYSEAITYYEKALAINNKNEILLISLSATYQIIGDFEQSKKLLKKMHDEYPNNIMADKMFSAINDYKKDNEHQKQMLEKLDKINFSIEDKATLFFSIAKSYSDQKKPEMSSKYFTMGNDLRFSLFKDYNFKEDTKDLNNLKSEFDQFSFDQKIINEKPKLIFIVGLPRSGTTLTHQIISSHSEVLGAGELPILKNFFKKQRDNNTFHDRLVDKQASSNTFREKVKDELLKLFRQYDQNLIILDKAPLNFVWIGYIKLLFPSAKIIHCRRNLKDTALSIYKNSFDGTGLPWSYDQKYLIKFIDLYKNLMNFWQSKLPNYIYDCHYENLVDNPIEETKNLIKFCNLEWEDQCLDHTKNKTGIKTVSIEQARKPIYKNSVNLNKDYLNYLDFLNQISE